MPSPSHSSFVTNRPGIDQGRVFQPLGFTPTPEGDHAFVMGAIQPNWKRRMNVGDSIDLFQTGLVDAGKILRYGGRIRGTSRMPALSAVENFVLSDGETVILSIDGGADQTITFNTADFATIGDARALEVKDAINSQLVGAEAFLTGTGEVYILSNTLGRRSRVRVMGGTATALDVRELAWVAKMIVDSVTLAELVLMPGEVRNINDMGANLAQVAGGASEIRFKLEVVTL